MTDLSGEQVRRLQEIQLEILRVAESIDGNHEANHIYAESSALQNVASDIDWFLLRGNEP